jgi:uncharacterized membrane protein
LRSRSGSRFGFLSRAARKAGKTEKRPLGVPTVADRALHQVTLVGLILAIFGVAFMFGGHPVIAVMLLPLAWVLVVLDEDMRSG